MGIVKIKYKKKNNQKVIYYCAEVYVKGVRISRKTFSKRRDAILWHERERQRLTLSPTSFNDQMRFRNCVDKFWKDAESRMMKSTLQSYEIRLSYFYTSPLANVKMSELKGMKVVEWINWLKQHPTSKNKGRKSFRMELAFLRTVLYWYRNFINEDFNVPITKKHRQMSVYRKTASRRPDYFIEPNDAKKWVEWLKEHRSNPVYWRLACFMLLTGSRVSEACLLYASYRKQSE